MYKKAKEFDSKIIGFETAIRRPYFHVKPLGVVELENWHNCLSFTEREGNFNKVFKLFERCLIACENYSSTGYDVFCAWNTAEACILVIMLLLVQPNCLSRKGSEN